MKEVLVFLCVYVAMVALAFFESCVEGRNAWDKKKLGWKIHITKRFVLPEYHFFLFFVFIPALLALPLVVMGWDVRLFGVILSAYVSGLVLEDFLWFIVNPATTFADWNPRFANYYPWIVWKRFRIPLGYVIGIIVSVASWYFLWR